MYFRTKILLDNDSIDSLYDICCSFPCPINVLIGRECSNGCDIQWLKDHINKTAEVVAVTNDDDKLEVFNELIKEIGGYHEENY